MKNIFTFLFLLVYTSIYSQTKSEYAVYFGCYTNGDTIPDDGFTQLAELTLLKNGEGQKEGWITTFNVFVYNKGKVFELKQIPGSQAFADPTGGSSLINTKGDSSPQKIVVESINISVKEDGQILKRKLPAHTFYRAKTSSKKC
jgi:hypothetical protein